MYVLFLKYLANQYQYYAKNTNIALVGIQFSKISILEHGYQVDKDEDKNEFQLNIYSSGPSERLD